MPTNDMPFADLVNFAVGDSVHPAARNGGQAAQLILPRLLKGEPGEGEIRLKSQLVVRLP